MVCGVHCFAVKNGWIDGYTDGDFRPNAPVTRAEAAKILSEAIQLNTGNTGGGTRFVDVSPESEFAPYISALHDAAVMSGKTTKRFSPDTFMLRTEAAEMIARVFFGVQ